MARVMKRLFVTCAIVASLKVFLWGVNVQVEQYPTIVHAPEVVHGTGEEIGFQQTNLKQLDILIQTLRELLTAGSSYLFPDEVVTIRTCLQNALAIQQANKPEMLSVVISELFGFISYHQSVIEKRQFAEWRNTPKSILASVVVLVGGVTLLGVLISAVALFNRILKNALSPLMWIARRSKVNKEIRSLRRDLPYNDEIRLIASDAVTNVLERSIRLITRNRLHMDEMGLYHAQLDYPGVGITHPVKFTVDPSKPNDSVQSLVDTLRRRHCELTQVDQSPAPTSHTA